MYCSKCGTELIPGANFCKKCGIKMSLPNLTGTLSGHSESQLFKENSPQQSIRQVLKKVLNPAKQDRINDRNSSFKKIVLFSVVLVGLLIAIIVTTTSQSYQKKTGNPQANLLTTYNYCCQSKNSEIYICYPTSRTIWQYREGDLLETYKSRYAVFSLFDTGSDLVLESIDYGFSVINKRTGEEKELLEASNFIGLNTYNDVLYYVTRPDESSAKGFYENLETYALNIKSGLRTRLANGGSYVSNEGIYFLTPNLDSYDVSFVEHSNLHKSVYKVVDNVKTSNQNDMPILLSVDNDWFYYAIYNNDSGYNVVRQSGGRFENLFTAGEIEYFNNAEAIFRIRGFSDFNRCFFDNQARVEKLVLEKTEKSFNSEASNISSFIDPKTEDEVFVTINFYGGGYLCLWSVDGTFLRAISISDAMF